MPHLFLTGYEKESLVVFLKKLKREKITTLIDIREIPLSRKNGFSKPNLKKELSKQGIMYYHFPGLGSPTGLRRRLKDTGDYLSFFKKYREYISGKRGLVNKLVDLVVKNGDNSALLCFERHSDLCHRSIVASEALKVNRNIKVIPL